MLSEELQEPLKALYDKAYHAGYVDGYVDAVSICQMEIDKVQAQLKEKGILQ